MIEDMRTPSGGYDDQKAPGSRRGLFAFQPSMRRRETAYTVALIICTVCLIVALGQQAWGILNP